MDYRMHIIWGVLLIAYGVFLLTRKKVMIRATYSHFFIMALLVLEPTIELVGTYNRRWPLFVFILLLIFSLKVARHRFILTNMDTQMVVPILTGILKEKNIAYERHEKKIILTGYDHKEIKYIQSLNTVDIDLNHIKNTSFLKEIEEKVFPSAGIFYIALGTIFAILLQR